MGKKKLQKTEQYKFTRDIEDHKLEHQQRVPHLKETIYIG
jgi:hypothetical protein